ncbi:MAG: serine hydrolase [Candidatus Delongbacteria bacterium]|nr:serine hydrolase [Candidatus Delongbacteria bacterium]
MRLIMIALILLAGGLVGRHQAEPLTIPDYYKSDRELDRRLAEIVTELGLADSFKTEDGWEHISLAVIDLNDNGPGFGGYRADNFIYPASVYKMYAGAALLERIEQGHYRLDQTYRMSAPNVVDRSKEVDSDCRPLLVEGDTVTIHYLLDLMLTRSDNSAANAVIDLAGRPYINQMMHRYGWYGSEVTRKFLKRKFEDPGYDTVRSTETCALHAADFIYRIDTHQLFSKWVSLKMAAYLTHQLDNTKLSPGLPHNAVFYHKTGWYAEWTHDVGLVDDGNIRYIVACFLPIPEDDARPLLKALSEKIYQYLRNSHP